MSDTGMKFWGIMAPNYDSAVDDSIGKSLRPAILDRLGREKNLGRVVEFGCGTGYFTAALARAADSVVATDFCDEMLAIATQRLKRVPNVALQKEDCMKPSFPDDTFDTAFMSLVLNLTDDPAQVLDQVHRVLKPDGMLFVAIPDFEQMAKDSIMCIGYRMRVNYEEAASRYTITGHSLFEKELRPLLKNAGFGIVSFEVIRDVSDSTCAAIDFVKAIKTQAASVAEVPRTIIEVGSSPRVIEVKNLFHKYCKLTAVDNVSFSVRKGEIFALLGPNGAGKTTIVEILECLKTPTRGFVNILGDAVLTGVYNDYGNPFPGEKRDYEGLKERIGVLPQAFNAFDLLTVRENLDYFARMYTRRVDIDRLIDETGLAEKKNARFKDLSGGLKQRVGVALALVNDPEVVFLDEPSAGLDPRARRDVWDIIKNLKARGKTVFLTTHYMDEAYHLADRICVIHRGSIVAEGSPDDLVDRYGGDNTLVLRECSPAAIDELLNAIPGSCRSGNDLQVRLPESDSMEIISSIVSIARTCNAGCKEVYVKKSTLDDAFLNLTGVRLSEKVG